MDPLCSGTPLKILSTENVHDVPHERYDLPFIQVKPYYTS